MKSFSLFLKEVFAYAKSTSFVLAGNGFHTLGEKESRVEHPNAFPHIYFHGHPYKENNYIRPIMTARAWGRVDHKNKVIHIVTPHAGTSVVVRGFGVGVREKHAENDIKARLDAISELRKAHPEYKIHHTGKMIDGDASEKDMEENTEDYDTHIKSLHRTLSDFYNR